MAWSGQEDSDFGPCVFDRRTTCCTVLEWKDLDLLYGSTLRRVITCCMVLKRSRTGSKFFERVLTCCMVHGRKDDSGERILIRCIVLLYGVERIIIWFWPAVGSWSFSQDSDVWFWSLWEGSDLLYGPGVFGWVVLRGDLPKQSPAWSALGCCSLRLFGLPGKQTSKEIKEKEAEWETNRMRNRDFWSSSYSCFRFPGLSSDLQHETCITTGQRRERLKRWGQLTATN